MTSGEVQHSRASEDSPLQGGATHRPGASRGLHSLVLIPEDSPHHADSHAEQCQEQHADLGELAEVGQAVVADPGDKWGRSGRSSRAACPSPPPTDLGPLQPCSHQAPTRVTSTLAPKALGTPRS